MSIILPILIGLHVLVCILMILVVLMQRPRSEGLGSAFGGGLTDNVFGSQTTNVLAKFTTWMGVAFFSITLLLSILTAKANSGKTAVQKKLLEAPVPVSTATPSLTPAQESTTTSETKTPEANPQASTEPVVEPSSTPAPLQAPSAEQSQPVGTPEAEAALPTPTDTAAPTANP